VILRAAFQKGNAVSDDQYTESGATSGKAPSNGQDTTAPEKGSAQERRERKKKQSHEGNGAEALRGDVLAPGRRGCELTEDGVAQAFAIERGNELRFCHGPNRWYQWDGTRWKVEPTRLAFDWVRELARRMSRGTDNKTRAVIGKANFAGGVERFVQSDRTFAVNPDLWDRDPWLLGTPGGTVDLRTGELRAPSREDYITKQTAITPAEPGTPCPLWHQFLDQITCGDRGLRRFIQQIFGYCLTGDVREECMFFLHGSGANGKGTLLGTMAHVLGDYAVASDMATFTVAKYDRHPTELAKLAGARMVTATETEQGRAWAWSRIKELTGNECAISARFMRRDNFEFWVTFKLVFAGNHKPPLSSTDEATERRVNMLPFRFTARNPDNELKGRLSAEYPAILRWGIDGCLDWQANGLLRPNCVIEATRDYLDQQDLFTQWVDAECSTGLHESDTHRALFASWSKFAAADGAPAGNGNDFHERMVGAGYKPVRHTPGQRGRRGYLGITVARPAPADWRKPQ
jgi:putative DNA primase/helicase